MVGAGGKSDTFSIYWSALSILFYPCLYGSETPAQPIVASLIMTDLQQEPHQQVGLAVPSEPSLPDTRTPKSFRGCDCLTRCAARWGQLALPTQVSESSFPYHMHGNDDQNASGHQRDSGNEQGCHMCADSGENLQCGPPKFQIFAPPTQHHSAADDESRKRHRDEEHIEAKDHMLAEPLNQTPGLRQWLNFAQEECGHKQRGGEHEEQLDDRNSSIDRFHNHFVPQSENPV